MTEELVLEIETTNTNLMRTLAYSMNQLLPEANVVIDSTGLHLLQLDSSKTAMMGIDVYPTEFESWERKIGTKLDICFSTEDFEKLVRLARDSLNLRVWSKDGKASKFQVTPVDSIRYTYELQLLSLPDEMRAKEPMLTHSTEVLIRLEDFQNMIRKAGKMVNHVKIGLAENDKIGKYLYMKGESDSGKVHFELPEGDSLEIYRWDEAYGMYSLNFLDALMKTWRYNWYNEDRIALKFARDKPLQMRWVGERFDWRFILAPRIERR